MLKSLTLGKYFSGRMKIKPTLYSYILLLSMVTHFPLILVNGIHLLYFNLFQINWNQLAKQWNPYPALKIVLIVMKVFNLWFITTFPKQVFKHSKFSLEIICVKFNLINISLILNLGERWDFIQKKQEVYYEKL